MGGTSSERDVSLASGLRIAAALRSKGHTVTAMDTVRGRLSPGEEQALLTEGVMRTLPPDRAQLVRLGEDTLPAAARSVRAGGDVDVVFLALHGGQGEDGTIQAMLDLTGVPYTGSGHLASALAMDKDLSKRLFRDAGVLTPAWEMVTPSDEARWSRADFAAHIERTYGLPVIVKPSREGSTVGLTLVKTGAALVPAIREALRYDAEVMVEQFIAGRELTVGVLGGRVLPVGEIIPKHELYDYECKYTAGMAKEIFPADLTTAERDAVQGAALKAYRALKLTGCARIDFRMSPRGEFHCLEANTLPGMTELSLVPQAAAAAGLSFADLCDQIVQLAMQHVSTGEPR